MRIERLREMRERRGLTQVELSRVSGISVASIVRAEHGGDVRVTNARRYAAALNCTISDLLGENPLPKVV
jgi:transcriptional regulator with XRE-family HTH domain